MKTEQSSQTTESEEREKQYETIVQTSMDGFWLVDMQGNFIDVNNSYCKIIGYSREELLKMKISDIEAVEKPGETQAHISKIKEIGGDRFETKHKCKDGRIIDVEISVSYQKTAEQIFVFTRDITERKKVEEELKNSDERFRQLTENSKEWVWEVNAEGLYTYSSPVVEKILGYKPEEIVSKKHFYDLFHPDDRENLKKAALEAFAGKEPFRDFINRNMHKNGEIIWLSTSGVPIIDDKGNLLGYRGLDMDITERKKAEEELKKLNEELKSKINELEQMNKFMTGRELKLIELKKEIEELKKR